MKQFVNRLVDLLQKLGADWFAWLAVFVGTVVIVISSIAAGEAFALGRPNPRTLEIVSVAWILLGALWTALGAHASPSTRPLLEQMSQTGQIDPKVLANMLLVNSRFATYGALMIVVGSAILVVNIFLPSATA